MCTQASLNRILNRVTDESQQLYGDKLNRIILYGSYARGDNDAESDIDVMILLDCEKDEVRDYRSRTSKMSGAISLDEEVLVSILLRNTAHFDENKEWYPFYRNVSRDGVIVYG